MSVALNATSAVLSLTSFTFYLIGVIGYSLRKEVIENINWFTVDHVNNVNVYVGLRKLIYQNNGATMEIIYGSGSSCNNDFCDVCEREGNNAFALLVVSTVFSFIAVALSVACAAKPCKEVSGANIAVSFVALVFGVIGWSLFINKCFPKIDDEVNEDFDYGPGAVLTLIAFLLSAITVVLQIVATALIPATPAPPAQPKAEAVATNEL